MKRLSRYWILNSIGCAVGLAAAVLLVVNRPSPPHDETPTGETPGLSELPERPGVIDIALPRPPVVPFETLLGRQPLDFELTLPRTVSSDDISVVGYSVDATPGGPVLRVDPTQLHWGLNQIHITGADRFGWPIDRAFSLVVSDTTDDPWINGAISVYLTRDGFYDDDRFRDDLSSIAADRIQGAIREIGEVEIGPVTASNFRARRVDVSLEPADGGLRGRVDFRSAYLDIDSSVVEIKNLPVHRVWIFIDLGLRLGADGMPHVTIERLEPHMDLVSSGEGAIAWLLDRGASVVEIVAEVLSEEPLREALTTSIDQALARWVTEFTFETESPLRTVGFDVQYRFGEVEIDGDGLLATVDFRLDCESSPNHQLGRFLHGGPPPQSRPPAMLSPDATVRIGLRSDAVNGVFHSLWRCGALDATVGFEEAHEKLPIAVPSTVATRFTLPPILQGEDTDSMVIAVGDASVHAEYPDSSYQVRATGFLPVFLQPTQQGRALEVGFSTDSQDLALFTDCVEVSGSSCRDNPLFDRLAWLAVPFLPPIGATIPLPDVRISEEDALRFEIGNITWDGVSGALYVGGEYVVEGAD